MVRKAIWLGVLSLLAACARDVEPKQTSEVDTTEVPDSSSDGGPDSGPEAAPRPEGSGGNWAG